MQAARSCVNLIEPEPQRDAAPLLKLMFDINRLRKIKKDLL
jgi:hypothetical protein